MAVVSSVSKLFLGRVQGLSRVAASLKYASTSTGKFANSNFILINASWCVKSKANVL
jgi:hypothetical protein